MHELSIVTAMLDLVTDEARKHGADKVTAITVVVGTLSGVEPSLLQEAFAVCRQSTVSSQATLTILEQDLEISCSCGFNGPVDFQQIRCPTCGCPDVKVTAGEEMFLRQVEMRTPTDKEQNS
ncbi:MAG: hydrogenase maturation nickel metallochaperone HypA [Thermodesulfobacteriota bacterium]